MQKLKAIKLVKQLKAIKLIPPGNKRSNNFFVGLYGKQSPPLRVGLYFPVKTDKKVIIPLGLTNQTPGLRQ